MAIYTWNHIHLYIYIYICIYIYIYMYILLNICMYNINIYIYIYPPHYLSHEILILISINSHEIPIISQWIPINSHEIPINFHEIPIHFHEIRWYSSKTIPAFVWSAPSIPDLLCQAQPFQHGRVLPPGWAMGRSMNPGSNGDSIWIYWYLKGIYMD